MPTIPTGLTPGSPSSPGPTVASTSVALSWTASIGATSYGVFVKDLSTNTLVVDTTTNTNSYTASLSANKPYAWNLNACNGGGCSGYSTVFYFQTPGGVPAIPTGLTPGSSSSPGPTMASASVALSWTASIGATSYGVFVKDLSTNVLVVDTTSNTNSYTASLSPNKP